MRLTEKNYSFNTVSLFKKGPAGYFKALLRAGLAAMPESTRKRVIASDTLKGYYLELRDHYRYIKNYIKPQKAARVYIRKGIGRMEFFKTLNERKIDYVLLRWWENLPEIPEGEDMDILIRDSHRNLINDLLTFRDNGTGLKCDVYTITGSNYGSHNNIPYFQSNLAHTLIRTRVLYRGVYVPSSKLYFASLAYHALFHKGYGSGLKGFQGTIGISQDLEHDYYIMLREQAKKADIDIEINVQGIFNWLEKEEFTPAEDTLSKLAEVKPELSFLQQRLYCDIRGGEILVYVIRERLLKDGLLEEFISFLEKEFQLDILDVRMLSAAEKELCSTKIRGGKWDKGPYKYSGGQPVALVSVYDYHPEPLKVTEAERQPRMTNRHNLLAKYAFRERLHRIVKVRGHYNGVHSADNEHDAWSYISLLGENYRKEISGKVEIRRNRYARRWNLEKTLSQGPVSKVEVIKYGTNLAVKKTFRPGRERFFKRELFATRELSKEYEFILPFLEEGNGYIILPYYEDILDQLPQPEREEVLISRINEIANIVLAFYSRGLAYINFSPENLLITSEGKLYCTGFSYLQSYFKQPANIVDAYEVAGVPKNFEGDAPEKALSEKEYMKKVWGAPLSKQLKNSLISQEESVSFNEV